MFTQKSHNEHKLVRCYECVCRGSGLGLHFRLYVLLQALHGTVWMLRSCWHTQHPRVTKLTGNVRAEICVVKRNLVVSIASHRTGFSLECGSGTWNWKVGLDSKLLYNAMFRIEGRPWCSNPKPLWDS